MKKPLVYLLVSIKDHRTYLGSTDNLKKRLEEHDLGKVKSTRYRRPLKLIYIEEFGSLMEARERKIL